LGEGMGEGLLPFCPNFSISPFPIDAQLASKRRPIGL
jgi:hypothetical protein